MKQHFRVTRFCLVAAIGFGCAPLVRSIAGAPAKVSVAKPLPLSIKLKAPVQGAIENNPMQPPVTFPANFNGRLVYTFTDWNRQYPRNLVIAQVSHHGHEQIITTSTYPIEELPPVSFKDISDPQFSPDGEHIVFKWGNWGGPNPTFDLYLWDLETQQLRRVEQGLGYRFSLWSPDSSHIAYIRNGNIKGNAIRDALELCVYDLKTGRERSVVKNDGVVKSVSWTSRSTLLFSMLKIQPPPRKKKAAHAKKKPEQFEDSVYLLDSYEVSTNGDKPKLLVKNAYRPTTSPDGQWIAFFGAKNPLKPGRLIYWGLQQPRDAALVVMRLDGSERKVLSLENDTYPSLRWQSDSKHLLSIRQAAQATAIEASIDQWDVATGKSRRIAVLKAELGDLMSSLRPNTWFSFPSFKLNRDGTFLLARVIEPPFESLQAVDLQSGAVMRLCEINQSSLDWHEEPNTTTVSVPNTK